MVTLINKTDKVVIGLDLDNTFADFSGAMRNFIANAAGLTDAEIISTVMPDPTGYSMENWLWEHTPFNGFEDAFSAAEDTGTLYSTMQAFDGATEAVTALQTLDYDVHVVTARKPAFEQETRDALDAWGLSLDKITFTNEKYHYPASIFIDDSPGHLMAFGERNIPSIAFTNAYNADLDDSNVGVYGRIDSWKDAPEMFEKVRALI